MKIMDKAAFEEQNVFGLGAPNDAFARYFAGRSYLNPLTRPEDGLFLANVTFEPGCRNNWHIHHASEGGGQLLICTAGEGWYQEEGKEAVSLEPGRVIVSPAESSSSRRRSKHFERPPAGESPLGNKARTVQRLSVSCFAAVPPESFPPGRNGGLHRIRLLAGIGLRRPCGGRKRRPDPPARTRRSCPAPGC